MRCACSHNRGLVVVPALVTKRLQPMNVNGKLQHQVGLTHHFGWPILVRHGDVVNDLTPNAETRTRSRPNTRRSSLISRRHKGD